MYEKYKIYYYIVEATQMPNSNNQLTVANTSKI